MLKVPDHQVAGHKADAGKLGPLIDESGCFYKPMQSDERGTSEAAFYTSFSSNTKMSDHITRYFPKFYSTQLVQASDGSGMQPHLVLQDLTFNRVDPSVMDVKIGSRTWAPQAPEDYINKCLKKDRESTSVSLGFRLSGLQVFESKRSGFWKRGKMEIMCLSDDGIRLYLKRYVSSNVLDSKPDCAFASVVYGGSTGILSQLLELKAWFEDQTIYHFYSCSVKLVDFAHVFEGKGVIDHNFLGGLCSLIKFISEILTTPDGCVTDGLSEDGQKSRIYFENGPG
ncbi:inositol polyphosphate multikinase [Orobanche gracilis]